MPEEFEASRSAKSFAWCAGFFRRRYEDNVLILPEEVDQVFLPVRTEIDEKFLSGASPRLYAQTLPPRVRDELQRANRFFDGVEVWGKREIEKDPIAVGYRGNDRYLIARWAWKSWFPLKSLRKAFL